MRKAMISSPSDGDQLGPHAPPWPERAPAVAVSFSGGGFRASLAGIGVIRGLADLGLLGDVRYTSSVSGGSWANALLALKWDELARRNFIVEAVDDEIVRPFVERITSTSLQNYMIARLWKVIGPRTRTDLLGDAFDDWFGHGTTVDQITKDVRFVFNSTNLNTGVRFGFDQVRLGDKAVNYLPSEGLRVADALAASAALPGALSAQKLPRAMRGAYERADRPLLVDGAVYDNLGLEPLQEIADHPLTVVLDAGGRLHRDPNDMGFLGTVKRSSAVGMYQLSRVREQWFLDAVRQWERWADAYPEAAKAYQARQEQIHRDHDGETPMALPAPTPPPGAIWGVAFSLGTSLGGAGHEGPATRHHGYAPDDQPEVPPWLPTMSPEAFRAETADVPMSTKKFDPTLCRDLIYRGWWLTRETLRTFHPDTLPKPPPPWQEWYGV